MTWFIDLRAQSAGGGVSSQVFVYQDAFLWLAKDLQDYVRNRDVVFATHGFNVDRAGGRRALSCWEKWLSLPATTAYIGVLWPGDSAWIPAVDYPIEGNEAIASGNLLAAFIASNLLDVAASVSFVSHSLGARVVLQTIRRLPATRVRNLMLMAGAIDDTCLIDEYSDAAAVIDKISVLSSNHDEVLALAFPIGNPLQGVVTRGSPYWHAALGRAGPPTTLDGKVHLGWQIPDGWDYGHHNYLPELMPARDPLPIPISFPDPGSEPSLVFDEWQAAWSAAMLSTRLTSA
jgi:hypothetical protein